jgi:hypothetical protein
MTDTILPANALPGILRQRRWQVAAVVVLLLLAGGVGYLIHGNASSANADKPLPTDVPLPAHAALTRAEHFVTDRTYNWYYTVPQMDDDAVSAYYQARLPQHGWRCVQAMKSINSTIYGQHFTASNIYITALSGGTKMQLYTAGGDYGAYLLEDDVPDGAVALKISLEPAGNAMCAGGATK